MSTKVKSVRVDMGDCINTGDTLVINNSCRFSTTKLPTKVSDLANDCCFVTEGDLSCAVCVKADKTYVDCCLGTKQDCGDYALNCTMTACLANKYDASNPCCYQTQTEVACTVAHKADKSYVDCCIERLENDVEQLQGRGKFLSNWNATTGKPVTEPETLPYTYHTGDYYMVTVVGSSNKKPTGSSYTGAASTATETSELAEGDMYAYDGTNWLLQSNHGKTVSFANLSGVPSDNACLCSELANKQNKINDIDTIRNNACCGACAKTIISGYGDIVSHNASEFQAAGNYVQYCDLTTGLSGKVDKVNGINRIYGTDGSGCQTDYAYSDTVAGNSIAKRDVCGNLCVADPTCNSHAATKGYVDDKVDNKTIYWGEINGTISCQTDLKTALNCKQDNIGDLDTIRSGASAGASAVQPGDLCSVATSGKYCDLTGRPYDVTGGTAIAVSNGEVSVCYDNSTIKVNNSDQIYADYTGLQRTCNLVTNFSSPDDTHYPSAKAVADIVEGMSGGNMIKEIYDPCNCRANIYDMDSMFDGTTNKTVTATEKELWSAKQEALTLPSSPTCGHLVVWGANKKTFVDGGEIPNSAQWGCITGTLCNQTDLQGVLDCKAQCCDIPTNNNQLSNGCGYTTCTGTLVASDLTPYAKSCDLGTAASKDTGTSSGNVPVLDSTGKLSTTILPALAITDTFTVASCSCLTTLSNAEKGDIAISTGDSKTYILSADPYSTASNWKELKTPTDAVTSVNGYTGAVTIDIPTDNCQLANSCGYTTCTGTLVASDLNDYAKTCILCTVSTSGKYCDLTGLPTIPTNNNQLTNGCGYTTCTGTISTCSQIISTLGYTPYNSTNPNGYTTCTGTLTAETVVSGDSGCTYTIKVSSSAPSSATNNTITFVV